MQLNFWFGSFTENEVPIYLRSLPVSVFLFHLISAEYIQQWGCEDIKDSV